MGEERRTTASGYYPGEWSTKPDYVAECVTCGWGARGRNVLGTAAVHARTKGHCVRVDRYVTHVYNHEGVHVG